MRKMTLYGISLQAMSKRELQIQNIPCLVHIGVLPQPMITHMRMYIQAVVNR